MIDQATIDRILDAADIVQVISEFVTLRKRGVNYVGLCPFHNEKTPSFTVSPAKRLCKCFSCGKGGNVVHFLMLHEQMSYTEALKFLAKRYGIEIQEKEYTPEEKEKQSLRESLFVINNYARDYFKHTLHETSEGQNIGMSYFRSRGFRDDIIEKFQLGYCLNKHDAFAKEAIEKGYHKDFLIQTGLCYETNDLRLLDRFWGRVMFPVHSLSGKIIAFGGRVLNTENKKLAKYVNSPESDIYHKSNELYGIFFAKQAIVKNDCCYLVEGYTDVISMHQSGIENVVASSGTSLTEGQIRLIHRFTDHITILYDGDMAGIKASLRGIDMLLSEGMKIKVLLLPDGDDPDSFARKHNASEYQKYIKEHEADFIRFKTSILLKDTGNDPMKKAELINNIVQSIAVIPEAIARDVYIKECSNLLEVEDKLLVNEVAKMRTHLRENKYKSLSINEDKKEEEIKRTDRLPEDSYISYIPEEEGKEGSEFYKYERLILQVIIRHGEHILCKTLINGEELSITVIEFVINELKKDSLNFYNSLHRQILKEAGEHLHDDNFLPKRYFSAHPNPSISELSVDLISSPYQLSKIYAGTSEDNREKLIEEVPMLVTNFKYAIVTEELKNIIQKLKNPKITQDSEQCDALMKRFNELHQTQCEMGQKLGERVIIP